MKLVFHTANDGVLEFEVDKNSVLVGRGSSCDVILKVEGISRQHCRIDVTPRGEFTVTDLGSTNGVLIDNARIPANEPISYSNYLPLSIGSVPHVTLEAGRVVQEERVISPREQRPINIELDLPQGKSKKASKKSVTGAAKAGKMTVEKQPPWLLIGIVVLAIITFTYFFFLS